MDGSGLATKEDIWRLQSAIDGLSTTQSQQGERIMRLEKKDGDGGKKSLWGPSSPFPSGLGSSQTGKSSLPDFKLF